MSNSAALERPILRPWQRVHRDESSLLLQYGASIVALNGRAVQSIVVPLLDLLDGSRTVADVKANFASDLAPAVDNALALLERSGVLIEQRDLETLSAKPSALFWSVTGDGGDLSLEVLDRFNTDVAIYGAAPTASAVAALLRNSGFHNVRRADWQDGIPVRSTLAIVIPSGLEMSRLRDFNERALRERRTWMAVMPSDGVISTIGPVFIPYETACAECYLTRRASNAPSPDQFRKLAAKDALVPSLPAYDSVVAGLAALLASRWLLAGDNALAGRFYAVSVGPDVTVEQHHVYRVPRCTACALSNQIGMRLPWYEEVTR